MTFFALLSYGNSQTNEWETDYYYQDDIKKDEDIEIEYYEDEQRHAWFYGVPGTETFRENGTIPALTKNNVGSFSGKRLEEGKEV